MEHRIYVPIASLKLAHVPTPDHAKGAREQVVERYGGEDLLVLPLDELRLIHHQLVHELPILNELCQLNIQGVVVFLRNLNCEFFY